MSDNKYIQRQEAIDFPGKKLPVVFCIDVSDSMNRCEGGIPTGRTEVSDNENWIIVEGGGHTIMQTLIERVKDFHNAMKEDRKTAVTCQTAYVTFGDKANKIEDFGIVKNKKAPVDKLEANSNNTYICDALEMSLKMLDDQKQILKDMGNDYFQPWLIILTDGKAYDDPERIKELKRELAQRQKQNKLIVYTMALSDNPDMLQQIRGYSIYKPIPYDKNKEELKKFFLFLKQSISSISNSKISDRVKPYTEPDDIFDLQ